MTTFTANPTTDRTRSTRARRFSSLVRAETTILLRNRTAVFTAVALPFVMAFAFSTITLDGISLGAMLTMMLTCTSLLFVIYFTLVTSLVARREQHTLKRLYAGEPTPLEILLAPAVPLWALLVVQSGIGAIGATLLGTTLVHPLALVLAIIGGAAAWTALAIISAVWTRTVESAQLTTLPLMFISLLFSGFSIPLEVLPNFLQTVAHWLPMTPVIDLITLAYTGTGINGRAVTGFADLGLAMTQMLLPLLAWTLISTWLGVRNFRWDTRA